MAVKNGAGILLYKIVDGDCFFFLVHPGGPFWKNKDEKAWSVPKGEYDENEDPLSAAKREFLEETSQSLNANEFVALPDVKSKSGKIVKCWLAEGDLDLSKIVSNTITIEWPLKSGKRINIPEVDRGEWFDFETASKKIHGYLKPLLFSAIEILNNKTGS